jgi:sigma-E factor negative regulatory protein RseB
MNAAQRNLAYEGTLVYLHGHRLATLHIAHHLENGTVQERLLALSGPVRAVARTERGVVCMLPDSHPITLPGAAPGTRAASAVLRSGPVDFERIRAQYLLHGLGSSRVAGRDTDVVGIVPRDNYRYGYRFFIDRETGLALKIDLMDDAAEPIEQVMFTQVEIEPPSAEAALETVAGDGAPAEANGLVPRRVSPSDDGAGWNVNGMPPGFVVMATSGSSADDAPRPAGKAQIVVGDGLASASIYIEPAGERVLLGATRMGAITALGARLGEHQVTVIGEIPERTARLLIEGLTPSSE